MHFRNYVEYCETIVYSTNHVPKHTDARTRDVPAPDADQIRPDHNRALFPERSTIIEHINFLHQISCHVLSSEFQFVDAMHALNHLIKDDLLQSWNDDESINLARLD
jgi:hypothetical protein